MGSAAYALGAWAQRAGAWGAGLGHELPPARGNLWGPLLVVVS